MYGDNRDNGGAFGGHPKVRKAIIQERLEAV